MENKIKFRVIDWVEVPRSEHPGDPGIAWWQTLQIPGLRIQIVEYSRDYTADHWCRKGHIVHCLEGEFVSEMEDGSRFEVKQGMTYVVSDGESSHKSITPNGAKLLIIDGDFLK